MNIIKKTTIILIVIVFSGLGYVVYFSTYAGIVPFNGEPENNLEILRQNPDINKFYKTYEKYGITIVDMTESQVEFAFIAQDGENKQVTMRIKYFDGKPMSFSHNCSQVDPRERLFLEENTIEKNCFEY